MTVRAAVRAFASAAAVCAHPGPDPSFQDIQVQSQAIQRALDSGETGRALPWIGPDGSTGTVTVTGRGLEAGCLTVRVDGPTGASDDAYCPTNHGVWVHPDEKFYRQATGWETYGGTVRTSAGGGAPETPEAVARALRREYHDCLRAR
ncbi:MAG: hypothetical protein VW268_01740 [Rhodospirillaceae bacterium]